MPRVVSQPRSHRHGAATQAKQHSPFKMQLNDDRQEKAMRLQSRQALQEVHMNQIRAAASPVRKASQSISDSPQTSWSQPLSQERPESAEDANRDDEIMSLIPGKNATPMKRMPILANFEEWMKMATDNKINAANSWNFALIDYFHDMSLLKEGDGVNFQKASCTLDGCVKIYTSRVDSVATETGKLLSGLAEGGDKKRKQDRDADGDGTVEDDEEDEEDGEGRKRGRKKAQRSSESTLAPSFNALQLKKFDLEFAVDPLFKKASADFDEGGAKGLLLNHLAIDATGRIVFDSSEDLEPQSDSPSGDDVQQNEEQPAREISMQDKSGTAKDSSASMIDLESLANRFFPSLANLDTQDICPSLKAYDIDDLSSTNIIPSLNANHEDSTQDSSNAGLPGADDDGDQQLGAFENSDDIGFADDDAAPTMESFGEGGEAWLRNPGPDSGAGSGAALGSVEMPGDGVEGAFDTAERGTQQFDGQTSSTHLAFRGDKSEANGILGYFDSTLKGNWAGPEHWKIKRLKDSSKASTSPVSRRKEKEPFEIDFQAPMDDMSAELIYTVAPSNSAISLPKSQWRSRTRNLLPDDKHFHSKHLLTLFLKPRARIGSRGMRRKQQNTNALPTTEEVPSGHVAESYWAQEAPNRDEGDESNGAAGTYDANFFQDDALGLTEGPVDNDDEDCFADAREMFSPPATDTVSNEVPIGTIGVEIGFGSQLVTQSSRFRPEYVQYARVAKKVDVRRLKEEMWKGLALDEKPSESKEPAPTESDISVEKQQAPLQFTSVMNNLQGVYPKQAMADISTSYCFICLLHLANEKGLKIDSESGLEDLWISKDLDAPLQEVSG